MRIISGTARGRRLFTPTGKGAGAGIRPTAGRVRESLFNILGDRVSGATVLDLFAGTGALGLEALSRGCLRAVFVDISPAAVKLVARNLDLCGFSDRAVLLKRDLLRDLSFLADITPVNGFKLIFADPPYRRKISEKMLKQLGVLELLSDDGLLIIEEASEVGLPEKIGDLQMMDLRTYGDTVICFYENS